MQKTLTPIATVYVVANVVLIMVLDALGTNREITTVILLICGGLFGALCRRYTKRKLMPIWKGQGANTEQNPLIKEEIPRH